MQRTLHIADVALGLALVEISTGDRTHGQTNRSFLVTSGAVWPVFFFFFFFLIFFVFCLLFCIFVIKPANSIMDGRLVNLCSF